MAARTKVNGGGVNSGDPGSAEPRGVSFGIRAVPDVTALQSVMWSGSLRNVQLESGPLEAKHLRVVLFDGVIDHVAWNRRLRTVGAVSQDQITFALLTSAPPGTFFQGCDMNRAGPLLIRGGQAWDGVGPAGGHWTAFSIGLNLLGEQLDSMGMKSSWLYRGGHRVASGSDRSIRLHRLLDSFLCRHWLPGAIDGEIDWDEAVMLAFVDAMVDIEVDATCRPCKYQRICRLSEEYMLEHLGDPLSIAALCRHCRCSRRYLEYAFRHVFGIAPARYFRHLRLNTAHVLLRQADPAAATVSQIAGLVGIEQLGRFAREYHRLFGVLPRATLAKSRNMPVCLHAPGPCRCNAAFTCRSHLRRSTGRPAPIAGKATKH